MFRFAGRRRAVGPASCRLQAGLDAVNSDLPRIPAPAASGIFP